MIMGEARHAKSFVVRTVVTMINNGLLHLSRHVPTIPRRIKTCKLYDNTNNNVNNRAYPKSNRISDIDRLLGKS